MTNPATVTFEEYLYHHAQLILFVISEDGIVLKSNTFTQKKVGRSPVGEHFRNFFANINEGIYFENWVSGNTLRQLANLNTAGGMPESFYFTSILSDEGILIIGEIDSGENEMLRTGMLSLNAELNNMLRSLGKQKVELEQANKSKNLLLGMAAHDLRNPLNNILMYCEFLKEFEAENFNTETKTILENITKSSYHMLGIIEDFLEMAELDSGFIVLNKELVKINEFISETVHLNCIMAQKKNITAKTSLAGDNVEILIDVQKMQQVLNNLISNAIKFSYPGSSIEISTKYTSSFVEVSVSDQGQGIPANEIDKLFKPFSKLSVRPTAGERSTGLGLSITKKIIEAHGGRIWVTSEPQAGSTFTFNLPT